MVLVCPLIIALAVPTCGTADGWQDTRVIGPFVCRADFPLNGLEDLFGQLAELQNDLVRCLGVPPAAHALELYLLHDERTYNAYLRLYLPQAPYRRALYVKSGERGMVFAYWSRELDVDLRHECTHALLHAVLPVVPLWLDEGLAEYFEIPPDQRAYENPHLSAVRWMARFGVGPKLESLEKKTDLDQMGASEYRDSWAWVHFMLHGSYLAHDELVRYLGDLQNHTPPGLMSQRLRRRVPDVERRFHAHFRSWKR